LSSFNQYVETQIQEAKTRKFVFAFCMNGL